MGGPVIYHGGADSRGPWPGGGGGGPPSPSEVSRYVWIGAGDFVGNQVQGQDNPPPPVYWDPVWSGAWFARGLGFDPLTTGGQWAQALFYLPANLNTAPGTLAVSLVWAVEVVPVGLPVDWHVHMTVENPGVNIAGGGPGTIVSQVGVFPQVMYTPVINVPPTRGGLAVPLVADRMYNVNVYRGDSVEMARAILFGVRIVYSITP